MEWKRFEDLVWEPHPIAIEIAQHPDKVNLGKYTTSINEAMLAQIGFANGYGISVVTGSSAFYCGHDGTLFEAAKMVAGSLDNDDVRGYLTEKDVTDFMIELQEAEGIIDSGFRPTIVDDIIF